MMYDGQLWGMEWMHLTGGIITVLVIAALIKYVFFRKHLDEAENTYEETSGSFTAGDALMSNHRFRPVIPVSSAIVAVAGMLGIYVGVLTLVSGWSFTVSQYQQFWPYILALAVGFGVQIGLFVYLKQIHAQHHSASRAVAVSGTTSTAAMLACCTHYLANLVPVLGMAGAITLIAQYQIQLFWIGLDFNLAALTYVGNQVLTSRRHVMGGHA